MRRQPAIRADLGAYVLIRANQLDNLDDWTSTLTRTQPWLPDALAIRVEFLARNSRHLDPVNTLLGIAEVGAPLFRSGIGYVADRATTYAALASKDDPGLGLSQLDRRKLDRIADVFDKLTLCLDMKLSTTVLHDVQWITSPGSVGRP